MRGQREFVHRFVKTACVICLLAGMLQLPAAPAHARQAAARSGAIDLVDAAGRAVHLPGPPRRIVIVGRAPFMPLHLLYMFGSGPARLAGFEQRRQTSASTAFVQIIDPAFGSKALLQPNPGPEQIAALKPDCVIVKGAREDQTCRSLGRIHIPVVYLGLEDPRSYFRDIRILGVLLGEQGRAGAITRFYRTRLEAVRAKVRAIPGNTKPRVLVLAYHDRFGKAAVEVPAASWMQTIQAREAGGIPVWTTALKETDGWTTVNFEQIAAWNPDCIFVACWYTFDPAHVIAGLRADAQWRRLKAVKTGRMHAIPSDLFGWDTPEPRWILGLTWMAARTWPGLFPGYAPAATMRAFFRELYRLDDKTIERRIMPALRPPS